MKNDPIVDEVRRVRAVLFDICDNDLDRWTPFQDTGFSFIMPPKEAPLLPACRDLTGLA